MLLFNKKESLELVQAKIEGERSKHHLTLVTDLLMKLCVHQWQRIWNQEIRNLLHIYILHMTTLYCRMKHFLVDIAIHHFLGRSRVAHEFQGSTPTLLLQPSCVHHTIWHLLLPSHTAFEPFLFRDYPIKLSQIYLSACPWCPSVFCRNFYIIGRSSDFSFFKGNKLPWVFPQYINASMADRTGWCPPSPKEHNKNGCITELK